MDIESLLRLLVPLGFLAIWAVSWLFNREGQPLPPRVGQGPGAGSGQGQAPRGFGLDPAGPKRAAQGEPLRWSNQTLSSNSGRGQGRNDNRGNDDDILILRAETRPVRGGPAAGSGSRSRRSRSRNETPERSPSSPRMQPTGLGSISQQVSQEIARPLDLTPLNQPSIPISNDLTHVAPVTSQVASTDLRNATLSALQGTAKDPRRLREAFLLAEILKPPPSARALRNQSPSNGPRPSID